jgi:DNA modification methylase
MSGRVEHIGENVTLYLGDCREILPTLGKVDAVVTDPPYGIAHLWKGGFSDKHGWGKAKDESITRNEWDEKPLSGPMLDLILAAGKQHVIWGGNYFDLPPSRCWLVWNKPERNFTLAEAELAWTSRDSVIRVFDYRRSDQGREHPTQKPLELMTWCIQQIPPPAALILDPFMGSGTTGVAAVKLGRKFIGIEIEPKYFDIACRRIANEASQSRMVFEEEKPKPIEQARLEL